MATEITADLIVDSEEFEETLVQDRSGWEGTRNYKCTTQNATLAMFARGLPKLGEVWGSEVPGLVVVRRGPVVRKGGTDLGAGFGGMCRVPITYHTPEASRFSQLPANVNDQWTEFSVSHDQFTSYAIIDRRESNQGDFVVACAPNNGDGTPVDVGILQVRVVTFRPKNDDVDLSEMLALTRPCRINDDELTLPPLYGSGARWTMKKGQVKYLGVEPSCVGDFIQLAHIMELSESFDIKWELKDKNGNPINNIITDQTHLYASFPRLWR